MLKDNRTNTRFRIHHHSFGQFNTNFLWVNKLPDPRLVIQIRTCWITKTVTFATIARSESLLHGHLRRIGKAPVLTQTAVQPFSTCLGGFNCKSLEPMRSDILTGGLSRFRFATHSLSGGDHKHGEVVPLPVGGGQDVIAEAESSVAALSSKMKRVHRIAVVRRKKVNRISVAFGFKKLPHCSNFHKVCSLFLQLFDPFVQFNGFGIVLCKQFLEMPLEPHVAAVE